MASKAFTYGRLQSVYTFLVNQSSKRRNKHDIPLYRQVADFLKRGLNGDSLFEDLENNSFIAKI